MTATITSDEVNYLVYRYLLESGFVHTAFTFSHEGLVDRRRLGRVDVPPGALIQFLHKGLQYASVEAHLEEDGRERRCNAPFSLLTPHACQSTQRSLPSGMEASAAGGATAVKPDPGATAANGAGSGAGAGVGGDASGGVTAAGTGDDADGGPGGAGGKPRVEDVLTTSAMLLSGHSDDTMTCAWNPHADILASGSNDATARIWTASGSSETSTGAAPSVVLASSSSEAPGGNVISVLDWNPAGTFLATGAQGGAVQVWDQAGSLQASYTPHAGPVMALRWNSSGTMLLSCSLDKTAVVWSKQSSAVQQAFAVHSGEIIDVAWRDDTQFASCATDTHIHVCELGKTAPVATFSKHTADINMVRWDPSKSLLASGSDDNTAIIWSVKGGPLHVLQEHTKEVLALQWSPVVVPLTLATASYDYTVKLWDATAGTCLRTLAAHTNMVYSVAFSPDGSLLASGAHDALLLDGALVKSYKGDGTVFEVSWNGAGNKVAACFAGGALAVVDYP